MSIEPVLKFSCPTASSKKTVEHMIFTGDFVLNRINSLLKPFDLTSQQYNVLRILQGQGNRPVSLTAIQERMINKKAIQPALLISWSGKTGLKGYRQGQREKAQNKSH